MNPLIQSAIESGLFKPVFGSEEEAALFWRQELEASAISPDGADGWLFYTTNKGILVDLGLNQKLLGQVGGKGDVARNHWLVRVMRNHKGEDYAVEAKPRYPGGSVKYVSPTNHTGVDIRGPAEDANQPLFIVEGGKKAACLGSMGLATVSINGCWGWGSRRDEELKRMKMKALHPHISALPLDGREVYVLLDADMATNPNVNLAARSLSGQLSSLKARVGIMQVPPDADNYTLGIDDYLASFDDKRARTSGFRRLVKRATAEVPPLTKEAEAELAFDRGCYTTEKGEPITNFTVEIDSETVVLNSDQQVQDRVLDITLHHQTKDEQWDLLVPISDLRGGKLWSSHLVPFGFEVAGAGPSFYNDLYNEIVAHQGDVTTEEVYGYIGWLGNRYLLPTGTIGPGGWEKEDALGVRLFEEGENAPWGAKATFALPEDEEDQQRSIIAMLDLAEVIPPQLLLAPMAATLETSEIHWWLQGMTARGKTHTGKILQSFWGAEHSEQVQQFANITESAFGTTASKVPGLLFLLDDAVNSMGLDKMTETKLNRFIRQAFGSGGGYQKGTRSGTGTRTLGSIRTSLLFTAEADAGGESFRNRFVRVEMPTEGFRNWEKWGVDVEANRLDGTYAKAMFQWLHWLAVQGGGAWGKAQAKDRARVNLNIGNRGNETVTLLYGVADLWLRWLTDIGHGPRAEKVHEQIIRTIEADAVESAEQRERDVGLSVQVVDILTSMLESRRFKVQDLSELSPDSYLNDMSWLFDGARTVGYADTQQQLLFVDPKGLRWLLAEAREQGRVLSGVQNNETGKGIVTKALKESFGLDLTRKRLPDGERRRLWQIPLTEITGG